jgi:selenide,water dikinase
VEPLRFHLVLAGGGHTHALLLRRWLMRPGLRPAHTLITLVSRHSTALYSGTLPALVAGLIAPEDAAIDLRRLCALAGVSFLRAEILGLDPAARELRLQGRPPLRFDRLSLDVGAVTAPGHAPGGALASGPPGERSGTVHGEPQAGGGGQPVKPLEPFLAWLGSLTPGSELRIRGGGAAAVELALALRARGLAPRLLLRGRELRLGSAAANRLGERLLSEAAIPLERNVAPASPADLACTGSRAPAWLAAAGLPVEPATGRVRTATSLQVLDHPHLFAAGDCAVVAAAPRPASGVWAVRAAPVLAGNLKRSLERPERPLQAWRPQRRALQLLGDGGWGGQGPRAVAFWGPLALGPSPWLWRWKRHLDQRFLEGFAALAPMRPEAMACRGCAAKLAAAPLEGALARLEGMAAAQAPSPTAIAFENGRDSAGEGSAAAVAVGSASACSSAAGSDTGSACSSASDSASASGSASAAALAAAAGSGSFSASASGSGSGSGSGSAAAPPAPPPPEDAAVVAATADGSLLLQSVDGFPALVADPWLNARLTTLHACGDLWASGAAVASVQALVTLPEAAPALQEELLLQTLAGVRSVLDPLGARLIGGHTLECRDGAGLALALTVNGRADPGRHWSKGPLRPGDALLLCGPLGSGVLFAAAAAGVARPGWIDAALESMQRSQAPLVELLAAHGCRACTDITGFGLLGHLGEMLTAGQAAAGGWRGGGPDRGELAEDGAAAAGTAEAARNAAFEATFEAAFDGEVNAEVNAALDAEGDAKGDAKVNAEVNRGGEGGVDVVVEGVVEAGVRNDSSCPLRSAHALRRRPLLTVQLEASSLPAFSGALELLDQGWASSLAPANARALALLEGPVQLVGVAAGAEPSPGREGGASAPTLGTPGSQAVLEALLIDPQTCGPLLAALPAERAGAALDALQRAGFPEASVIGRVLAGPELSPGR